MYSLHFLPAAEQDLAQLDKVIAPRVINRIRWLAANLDNARIQPLTGNLAGLYKLRTGDYRVLFELVREKELIVIHAIGHRRDIYRG